MIDGEVIKLIGKLNEDMCIGNKDVFNYFYYCSDGLYFHIKYGDILIVSEYDISFNSIDDIKKEIKNAMIKLSNELKVNSKLLNG